MLRIAVCALILLGCKAREFNQSTPQQNAASMPFEARCGAFSEGESNIRNTLDDFKLTFDASGKPSRLFARGLKDDTYFKFDAPVSRLQIGRYARRAIFDKVNVTFFSDKQMTKASKTLVLKSIDYFDWFDGEEHDTFTQRIARDRPHRIVIFRFEKSEDRFQRGFFGNKCDFKSDDKVLAAGGADYGAATFTPFIRCDLKNAKTSAIVSFNEEASWVKGTPEDIPLLKSGTKKTTISGGRTRKESGVDVLEYYRFGDGKPLRFYFKGETFHKLIDPTGETFVPADRACSVNFKALRETISKLETYDKGLLSEQEVFVPDSFPPLVE